MGVGKSGMDIREAIIENFGEDDFVVVEMNKHGLDHGIALAKQCIHHDNMSEAGKIIRFWQPPMVLEKEPHHKPATPPMKRAHLRPHPVLHYSAQDYCHPKSFLRRVLDLVR